MAEFRKFFTAGKLVDEVDFDDPATLINLWRERVYRWYLEPIKDWPKTGHEAFVALLAVRQVLLWSTEVMNPQPGAGIGEVLRYVDARFRLKTISGETVADRIERALGSVGVGGLRMGDTEGISGLGGELFREVGECLVFDPWTLRDLVQTWFLERCKGLALAPESEPAQRAVERLRAAFAPAGGEQ